MEAAKKAKSSKKRTQMETKYTLAYYDFTGADLAHFFLLYSSIGERGGL